MSHLLAVLSALFGTAILAAIASSVLFGDFREGFRMLYTFFDGMSSDPVPRDAPQESRRSAWVQFLFVIACLAVASAGYLGLIPVFDRG